MKKRIKGLVLVLLIPLFIVSCNPSKIDRIHVLNEEKCYTLQTDIIYAKYYIYANGKRYRRNDVALIEKGKQCPYCLEREVLL